MLSKTYPYLLSYCRKLKQILCTSPLSSLTSMVQLPDHYEPCCYNLHHCRMQHNSYHASTSMIGKMAYLEEKIRIVLKKNIPGDYILSLFQHSKFFCSLCFVLLSSFIFLFTDNITIGSWSQESYGFAPLATV